MTGIFVRELEWNADDADTADLHRKTPCYSVKHCDTLSLMIDGEKTQPYPSTER